MFLWPICKGTIGDDLVGHYAAALLVHAESPRAFLYKLGLARATVEPRGVACGSSRPLNVRNLVIGDTRLRRRRSRLGAAYVNPLLAQTRGIIHISQPV